MKNNREETTDIRLRDKFGQFRRANSDFDESPSRRDARPQSRQSHRTDSDLDLRDEIDDLVRKRLKRHFIECPVCHVLFLQEDGIKHCGYVYDIETDDWGKCSEEEESFLDSLLEGVDEDEAKAPVEVIPPEAVQVKSITVSDEPFVDVKSYAAGHTLKELRDSTRREIIPGAVEGDKVLLSRLPVGTYHAEYALQKGESHVRIIKIVKVEKKKKEDSGGGFFDWLFGSGEDEE